MTVLLELEAERHNIASINSRYYANERARKIVLNRRIAFSLLSVISAGLGCAIAIMI